MKEKEVNAESKLNYREDDIEDWPEGTRRRENLWRDAVIDSATRASRLERSVIGVIISHLRLQTRFAELNFFLSSTVRAVACRPS